MTVSNRDAVTTRSSLSANWIKDFLYLHLIRNEKAK